MDTTEGIVKAIEAGEEYNKLVFLVKTQRIIEIPRQAERVDSLLWELREVYSRTVAWEPAFRTIIKKYVDITDIKVN